MKLQRILVATDFSPAAEHALHWALHLARKHGAMLHLLHVMADDDRAWFGDEEEVLPTASAPEALEDEVHAELDQCVAETEKHGVAAQHEVRYSLNVADTILEVAETEDVDLIVTGTHGREGLSHVILGSVAETVVRRAHRPVLTVRTAAPEVPELQRVLSPVDFSEPSKAALRLAKDIAAAFGARLDLLFVAEARTVPVFSDTGIPHLNTLKMDPEIVKDAGRALEQLNSNVSGADVEAHGHVAEGTVPEQIVHFVATHDVDLIVLATRGLSGLDRWLVGSVTQRVVRTAPCPVLTLNVHEGEERGDTGERERA